jgi:hypothetical protein
MFALYIPWISLNAHPCIHLNSPFMGYPQCFMWKEVASKHIHCVHLLYFYAFSIFPVDSLTKVKKKDIVVKNYMRGEQSIMSFWIQDSVWLHKALPMEPFLSLSSNVKTVWIPQITVFPFVPYQYIHATIETMWHTVLQPSIYLLLYFWIKLLAIYHVFHRNWHIIDVQKHLNEWISIRIKGLEKFLKHLKPDFIQTVLLLIGKKKFFIIVVLGVHCNIYKSS